MFGTLITLGLGLFGYGSLIMDSVRVDESKEEAIKEGLPYYWGADNKMHSIETGEICMPVMADPSHNYHHTLEGVRTHRVYYDYTLAKAKELNEEAKKKGQKFYWKEYTSIQQSGGRPTWMAFDPIVGLPYKKEVKYASGWQCVDGGYIKPTQENRLIKKYYKEPKPGEVIFFPEYDHSETVYGDEIKAWDYGCAPVYYK